MLRALFAVLLLSLPAWLEANPALRVGMSTDNPPLAYRADGRLVGIEPDNVVALGKLLARPMTLMEMPAEQLLAALQAGSIDIIMSGLTITEQQSALVDFTAPYVAAGQMAIVLTAKAGRFSQPWVVYRPGVRVGVRPQSGAAQFMQREAPEADLHLYNSAEAAFSGLRSDEIDLYIDAAPVSWQLATSKGNDDLIGLFHPLTEEHIAWAVRKGNTALLADLNRALELMRSKGTLDYILSRWIPVRVENR